MKQLSLGGATGYNQGPSIMNSICEKIYTDTNKNINARNLDAADIEEIADAYLSSDAGSTAYENFKEVGMYKYNENYNKEYSLTSSINIPNCYSQADITSMQDSDLRPTPCTEQGYTNRNNVKLKNLSYEIPGTNLNNLVSEKYNAILNNNMWLASRYVYVLKNTSSDSYWISFNLSVYDYSSALNDNSSGYLFGNNTSGINKTHYLAPVCILNSSTPIDYVSTDNEVNTWKIE